MSHIGQNNGEIPFGDREALLLHQLRLLEWQLASEQKTSRVNNSDEEMDDVVVPENWRLIEGQTEGMKLYQWQIDCLEKWFNNNCRGTVKVVTGGGKTLFALAAMERLQNTKENDLRVAIVVPTIVLMHQWYDAILEHGNLSPGAIGRLGGGYKEDFREGRVILITVLASAWKGLSGIVQNGNVGDRLLLIVDECHRSGADKLSSVFKTERAYSLGLSATPERDEDIEDGYNESTLGKELGPIIYEFALVDALEQGLVPKFTINHYGLPMTPGERSIYDKLSRSISDARKTLQSQRPSRSKGDFFGWVRSIANQNKGELSRIANRFIYESNKRKEVLTRLESRHHAVERLIKEEFALNQDARIILFHESISEVMHIYTRLYKLGIPVIAEHSKLPDSVRETGLDLFRRGIAQVIVSAKSLIEGFNVPAVDVGIIVASSGSVRQRIQSLGRVLRKHRGKDGVENTSCVHVLYARKSTDEFIYGNTDWGSITGADSNQYFHWDPPDTRISQERPPKSPMPRDDEIDPETLSPGKEYPGLYEGEEYGCDQNGNIQNDEREYAIDSRNLVKEIIEIKGTAGKFRITPKRYYVLVRIEKNGQWTTVFVMQLSQPLSFQCECTGDTARMEIDIWLKTAHPGDEYPFSAAEYFEEELKYKQKRGGVIAKKVRGGELFARRNDRAEDPVKGMDADRIIEAIQGLNKTGRSISKFAINSHNHAVFREGGQLFFICALNSGLDFPDNTNGKE